MSKFKIVYTMSGEVEIDAENMDEAVEKFDNGVGFSNDDIYENLDNNPIVDYAEKLS